MAYNNNPRPVPVKVKTAKGRKPSSTNWLQRHLNDPYVHQAKAQGYVSRAAFKLIEIDDRYKFLSKDSLVVDLGAAPGGWSQVAKQRVGSDYENVKVIAVDCLSMSRIPGVKIVKKDFLNSDAPEVIMRELGGKKPNVVLSDMAVPTTGHPKTDHYRTMSLVKVASEFVFENLEEGGTFLTKTFKGGTERTILEALKRNFTQVYHIKPPSSRPTSVELYMLAMGRRKIIDSSAEAAGGSGETSGAGEAGGGK